MIIECSQCGRKAEFFTEERGWIFTEKGVLCPQCNAKIEKRDKADFKGVDS